MRYTAEAETKLRARSSAGAIIACGQRRSHATKPTSRAAPTTIGAATAREPHGCEADSVSPRVTENRPAALAAAPGRSRRPARGLRVGRTATAVIVIAMTAKGRLTQNTLAQPETLSRI